MSYSAFVKLHIHQNSRGEISILPPELHNITKDAGLSQHRELWWSSFQNIHPCLHNACLAEFPRCQRKGVILCPQGLWLLRKRKCDSHQLHRHRRKVSHHRPHREPSFGVLAEFSCMRNSALSIVLHNSWLCFLALVSIKKWLVEGTRFLSHRKWRAGGFSAVFDVSPS